LKKTVITIACLAAFAFSIMPAFAQCGCCGGKSTAMQCAMTKATPSKPAGHKPAASKKIVSAVCPVMGNKIPDVTKAAGKSVYKGKTYYFCCPGCKPKFDKNPEKYIHKK